MSRRRHEVRGNARPNGGGRPRPGRRPPRRKGFIARAGERGVALTVLAVAAVAIAGVAVAGALSSGGTDTVQPDAASTQAPVTSSPSPSPRRATPPTPQPAHSSSPKPAPKPAATVQPTLKPTPTPVATHAVASPTPKPTKSSSCPSTAAGRVAKARGLLQHREALPNVTLITAGPRQGLLGSADAQARTLTLYVRSCSQEPTLQLAVVWGYEAGQFIRTETWDAATRTRWNNLRGSSFTSSAQFKQDAASVFAFWQTGSTQYWQSPVAPPSFSKLSQLVPYLKTS
jgi:hypothetical protein